MVNIRNNLKHFIIVTIIQDNYNILIKLFPNIIDNLKNNFAYAP